MPLIGHRYIAAAAFDVGTIVRNFTYGDFLTNIVR